MNTRYIKKKNTELNQNQELILDFRKHLESSDDINLLRNNLLKCFDLLSPVEQNRLVAQHRFGADELFTADELNQQVDFIGDKFKILHNHLMNCTPLCLPGHEPFYRLKDVVES